MLDCIGPDLASVRLGRKPVVAKDFLNFESEIQSEPATIDPFLTWMQGVCDSKWS